MSTTDHPDLDLAALRMLTLVADLGSISAAARAEQISQPSASKRIQVLERQLRLELLDRRTRGAVLTADGRMITDWCRTIVDAVDTLVTGSRALSTDAGGQLSLAASQTIAEYPDPSWLNEFRRRGRQATVQLRVANSQDVISAVRARTADLGFVETPTIPTDLHCRKVATDRLVLVASPDHPLARRRRPVTAAELAAMPLVSREAGSGTREACAARSDPRWRSRLSSWTPTRPSKCWSVPRTIPPCSANSRSPTNSATAGCSRSRCATSTCAGHCAPCGAAARIRAGRPENS